MYTVGRKEPYALSIGAVLLAAGQSSRMPPGQHKLLIQFASVPLVQRSAKTLVEAGLPSILAVTGYRHCDVQSALAGLPITIGFNEAYAGGVGSSLSYAFSHPFVCGLDGVLIMLADMPFIEPDHIRLLVEAFRKESGEVITRASNGNKPGHPVIVPKSLFANMKGLDGDMGAQDTLRQSSVAQHFCDIGRAATFDIDTIEDAKRAAAERTVDRPAHGLTH